MPLVRSEFHDSAAILESSQNGRGWLAGMGAKPRILLVEDDRQLAGMLADLFEEEGHEVDVAHDGQVGLHLALTRTYDAFVFDRGVPVIDGVELLRTLRVRDCSVPSLILTARGSVGDRVEGLDAGAEDYLVKPFEIPELLARMRALLRRRTSVVPIVVGRWEIDRANRTATDTESGSVTSLSERESELLGFLCASPGQVFSRTQLLGRVFGSADTPGTVDTYVHYLRRKLGRDVVATVHGLGYRLGS